MARGSGKARPASAVLCAAVLGVRHAWASAVEEFWSVMCNTDCDGVNTCMEKQLCVGETLETSSCPDNPECLVEDDRCPPSNCQWHEWTEWTNDGISGLCGRERAFTPNRCGGKPCIGVASETKYCDPVKMLGTVQDCEFATWSEWAACDPATLQRSRKRFVATPPSNGGRSCDGPLILTEPCGVRQEAVDCQLSDWLHWSGCSHACGGGQHMRLRTIKQQSQHGGKLCGDTDSNVLMETKACNAMACESDEKPQDCELGGWGDWGTCTKGQHFRDRQVLKPAAHGGQLCKTSLKEVAACTALEEAPKPKIDCKLADWEPWTLCSKTCMGGQTGRKRSVLVHAENGGAPCEEVTAETKPCNDFPCSVDAYSKDCALSQWSDWAQCSSHCGQGLQTRSRGIKIPAVEGGMSCSDPLEEARPCENLPVCDQDDCKWGDWSRWSLCSQSCGGGHRSRNRTVAQQPTRGGKACEALDSVNEVHACNSNPCYLDCVDGLWGSWDEWASCSVSCDAGVQWRHRSVAITATACGVPAEGDATEVRRCDQGPCEGDKDCVVGDWASWAECSTSCDGVKSRTRSIEVEASGLGARCGNTSLEEVMACNGAKDFLAVGDDGAKAKLEACGFAGHEPVDCELADWEDWSECSRTCDGGQRKRDRKIKTLPQHGGAACEKSLREVVPCDTAPCTEPADCKWGDWDDWMACSRCDGERMRKREVLTHAQGRGQPCKAGESQEMERCDECPPQKLLHCVWGEWTTGECSVSCGTNGWSKKVRQLEGHQSIPTGKEDLVVGNVTGDYARCEGSEVNYTICDDIKACDGDKCEPEDCKLSEWLDWEEPTKCEGLCSRSRYMLSAARCGGKQCDASLTETKACPSKRCQADKPCEFGEWSLWTRCSPGATQRTREREVKSPGGPEGAACEGPTRETEACELQAATEAADCELGDWTMWGDCSRTCGVGTQEKSRVIANHAVAGGKACSGDMRQMRACSEGSCGGYDEDCLFGDWEEWYGCTDHSAHGKQATRVRSVKVARGDGLPCAGAVMEAGPCGDTEKVNCKWDLWSNWGKCSEDCGGGQQFRTREIVSSPKNGGDPCEGDLEQTQRCNEQGCSAVDCQTSGWSTWSSCNANCGQGQQIRHRQVLQGAQQNGNGCTLSLEESRGCTSEGGGCDGDKDCEWGVWSQWSDCFKAELCGVGYRRRVRAVEVQAQGAGKTCEPMTVEEVAASPTCPGSCDARSCVDGAWGDWADWEQCSVSCGQGGTQLRERVVKVEANDCGTPAEGESRQYRSCGSEKQCDEAGPVVSQDCIFSGWTAWVPLQCPAKCNGMQNRTRTIVRYSSNGGMPCEGATSETTRCNPGPGEDDPEGCESGAPVDCVLQQWSGWSRCSATCGTGHRARARLIAQGPKLGGKACEPSLVEIKECNASAACVDWSTDCQLAEWSEWSQCDDLAGQMTRTRGVGQLKVGFGNDCEGARIEVRDCNRECQDKEYSCGWAAWSSWSKCSTPCGPEGRRTRVRQLQLSLPGAALRSPTAPAGGSVPNALQEKDATLMTQYSEIHERLAGATSKRTRDLATAFGGGVLAFVALMGVLRLPFGRGSAADERVISRSLRSPLTLQGDAPSEQA